MTNVRFARKEIEKEIKLTDEVIEKISLFGTPLESISDELIEIEVFPNRPDLISLQGFLRSFKSFLGMQAGLKEYNLNKPEKNYKVKIDSSVDKVRPFTVCAIAKNLNLDDEKIKALIDLQEKLHITVGRNRKKAAIGIYPLDKIKLPIKYTTKKPSEIKFIPLGSKEEMNGWQILKKHPTGKAYADILKNEKEFPVFIDSNNKILSLPPLINSEETGRVDVETKEVFIECSGNDLEILKKVLNIIVTTLSDMGADIFQMELDYKKRIITPDLTPEQINISVDKMNKLLGLNLKEKEVKTFLEQMGYEYKNKTVLVPAWRTDILHEVDIIEDIAIAYGYDNFAPELPKISSIAQESDNSKFKSKVQEILIGLGLIEISSYHLITLEEAKKMRLKEKIELENSKTEYKLLRPNLLIPSLRILSENKDSEYPQNIFEIGKAFRLTDKTETGIKENNNLIIALTPGNFTQIKQHLDYLMDSLSIKYSLSEHSHKALIEGRTGKIIVNDKPMGYIGEMHPNSLKNWNLKFPLAVLELNLDKLQELI